MKWKGSYGKKLPNGGVWKGAIKTCLNNAIRKSKTLYAYF